MARVDNSSLISIGALACAVTELEPPAPAKNPSAQRHNNKRKTTPEWKWRILMQTKRQNTARILTLS